MAATLQGIWNDQIAPSWDSKYTININTEMNYWPAEVTNLSELHEPLFDLSRTRAKTAGAWPGSYWGARFRDASQHGPLGGRGADRWRRLGHLADGAAWLSLHLWEHYDFTRDREFLAERAYPVMKEAAEFLLDYLVEDEQGPI